MLDIGRGFQADEVRRRAPDDTVPTSNALFGKAGRRIEAKRTRTVIDEIAYCRVKFLLPLGRNLKSRLEVLHRGTMVTLFSRDTRNLADADDCLVVVDTGNPQTAHGGLGEIAREKSEPATSRLVRARVVAKRLERHAHDRARLGHERWFNQLHRTPFLGICLGKYLPLVQPITRKVIPSRTAKIVSCVIRAKTFGQVPSASTRPAVHHRQVSLGPAHGHIEEPQRLFSIGAHPAAGHLIRTWNDHGVELPALRLVNGRDDDLLVTDEQIRLLEPGQLLPVFG